MVAQNSEIRRFGDFVVSQGTKDFQTKGMREDALIRKDRSHCSGGVRSARRWVSCEVSFVCWWWSGFRSGRHCEQAGLVLSHSSGGGDRQDLRDFSGNRVPAR